MNFDISDKKSSKKKKKYSSNRILFLTIAFLVVIIVLSILFGKNDNNTYTLEVIGDANVTIYKGSDYNDPGAMAYDEDDNDVSDKISVNSNLDVNNVGTYEIIYTFHDVYVKRIVKVVEKSNVFDVTDNQVGDNSNDNSSEDSDVEEIAETTITLKGVETAYIDIGGTYNEEGYTAYDTIDGYISKNVVVTHNVDNTKAGTYQVVYTVKNSAGITTSVKRNIVVMSVDLKLSLSNSNYTNENVGINVVVSDDYFDYLVLPNGQTVGEKSYNYMVSENGTYKFILYNKYGVVKEKSITVSNIDKTAPTACCSAKYSNGKTTITVTGKDNVGIKSYVLNGKTYSGNKITVDSLSTTNNVVVYDKAGNSVSTSCNITSSIYVDSISKDGVIITVKAKPVNTDVAGYYFSYDNTLPDKSTGGYISTSSNSIDVVRLPGSTYVWVEDTSGRISEVKRVSISNDALIITSSYNYKTLKGQTLDSYLTSKGWSIDELNNLMARSVRAAGLYTKDAAATSAIALQVVLSQKYGIKLPYWWGGKSWDFGANKSWGTYREKYSETYDRWYYYYGMDCSGFVTWAYVNAGYNIKKGQYPSYWSSANKIALTKENGDVGDFIVQDGHVKMIVGKTSTGFICAEAAYGMCISTHAYTKTSGFYIVKGEMIGNTYSKYSRTAYPSGF